MENGGGQRHAQADGSYHTRSNRRESRIVIQLLILNVRSMACRIWLIIPDSRCRTDPNLSERENRYVPVVVDTLGTNPTEILRNSRFAIPYSTVLDNLRWTPHGLNTYR